MESSSSSDSESGKILLQVDIGVESDGDNGQPRQGSTNINALWANLHGMKNKKEQ